MLWPPLSSSVIGIECMPIRFKFLIPSFSLSRHSPEFMLGSDTLYPISSDNSIHNRVPTRPPLGISSYPNRRYDEDPDGRMTTRRDAPMQKNEGINEED